MKSISLVLISYKFYNELNLNFFPLKFPKHIISLLFSPNYCKICMFIFCAPSKNTTIQISVFQILQKFNVHVILILCFFLLPRFLILQSKEVLSLASRSLGGGFFFSIGLF